MQKGEKEDREAKASLMFNLPRLEKAGLLPNYCVFPLQLPEETQFEERTAFV